MATDDERRRVAERLREFTKDNQWPLTVGGNSSTIRHAISDIVFGDKKYHSGVDLLDRLADLIEPAPTSSDRGPTSDPTERGVDSIYDWCFEHLEGADGPEDELYCSIMSAIEEYRHTERITARTARPVDRRALLRLAEEMEAGPRRERCPVAPDCSECAGHCSERLSEYYARRIREACGERAS